MESGVREEFVRADDEIEEALFPDGGGELARVDEGRANGQTLGKTEPRQLFRDLVRDAAADFAPALDLDDADRPLRLDEQVDLAALRAVRLLLPVGRRRENASKFGRLIVKLSFSRPNMRDFPGG